MSVGVSSHISESESRAEVQDEDFEAPDSKYEKMNTLRVIIVRGERFNAADGVKDSTGYVEHNHLFKFNDGGIVLFDDMIFKVSGGEKKKIYLIANENFLKSKGIDFDELNVKTKYPDNFIENITLTTTSGMPLIDNSESSENHYYIPMSEVFDLDVPTPQNPADYQISKNYFVTRAAVKFSFNILTPDYPTEDRGVRIKNITVNSIGNSEYFLPRDTEYEPAKDKESSFNYGGRIITKYTLPTDPALKNGPCAFTTGLENIILNNTPENKGKHPFVPYLYFPESYIGDYTLSITLGDNNPKNDFTFPPVNLDNLSSLPRNTHVVVNITLKSPEMEVEVRVAPYIGITLDPIFGNDQIVKPPKPRT